MRRRRLVPLAGSAALCATRLAAEDRVPQYPDGKATLASAPIEVQGDWGGSLPLSARTVVTRMRDVSLAGLCLLSDRQPERLRVDSHTTGPPHIWLHFDGAPLAWIVVDVGPRDWSRLAYQFGHELGHVLCNSWGPDAKPRTPCQWLEEALVEAFAVRGLGRLAQSWAENPPFAGDSAFAASIGQYRDAIITAYRTVAAEQGAAANLAAWFDARRSALESDGGVAGPARAAVPAMLAELEANPAGIDGLGALNRWPGRSGVPIEDYLRLWKRSCAEIAASQLLPIRLRSLLLR